MAAAMTRDVMKGYLMAVPLFKDLQPGELDMLASTARTVTFRKGARIFEEGTQADCCFVLTAGRARVVLSGESGTEILLHVVLPGDVVGELALLDKSTRSASLVAGESCHLIRISATALDVLRKNANFEQRLIVRLVTMLRESDDRVRVVSSFPSINRVAWCLARVARYAGRREGSRIVIPKTAHSELAEMAGCTRETVSRALYALQRKKYVSWDTRAIFLDVDGMQRYLTTELIVPGESGGASRAV
jgi:CRP-like cAMP-binding protein